MKCDTSKERSVTAAQAVRILRDNGLEISEKEAGDILEFLYFLGKLSVDQYVREKKEKLKIYEDS